MTQTTQALRILIVEDELIIASDIEMILTEAGYEVIGIVTNHTDALAAIASQQPNLILLDINLEGDADGVIVAEDINRKFHIPFIYLTSNTDPLTINRVKRTNPAGFIVKPFNEKDILTNIEIVIFNNEKKVEKPVVEDFFIKENGSLIKLKTARIMFAKADENYTKVYTDESEYLISTTLKKLAETLNATPFIRIHRSFIVNVNYIDRIQNGYVFIGKHHFPIGRRYHDDFFNRINKL